MPRRTLFTDPFSGGDANPIPSPWEAYSGIDTLQVVGGRVRPSVASPAVDAYMRHNGVLQNDQWASARLKTLTSAFLSIHIRKAAPNTLSFYYLQAWRNGGVTDLEIGKVIAGTYTTLLNETTAGVWALEDVILFDAVGTTLTGYVNDVQKIQVTGQADLTAGGAGLSAYVGTVANAEWDDFASGDFGAAEDTVRVQLADQATLANLLRGLDSTPVRLAEVAASADITPVEAAVFRSIRVAGAP